MARIAPGRLARLLVIAGCAAVTGCGALAGAFRGAPDTPSNPDRVGPAVLVAAGRVSGGPWRAWVYRTRDGSLCLEFATPGGGGSSCGPGKDGLTGIGVSSDGDGVFVSGGSRNATAVGAKVRLSDGSTSEVPFLPPNGLTPTIRLFVAVLPADAQVGAVDIVDAAGRVLETIDLSGATGG